MRFDQSSSVRSRLTITLLGAIALSWIVSTLLIVSVARFEARAMAHYIQHSGLPPAITLMRISERLPEFFWSVADTGQVTVLMPMPASRLLYAVLIVLAGLLALVAGAWASRFFTRPLSELADGARAFQDGRFDHRIALTGMDEFSRVAASMNTMAARVAEQITVLEGDARRRRQLLADVAHELRSPVSSIKTMAEALRDGMAQTPERRERALATMIDRADRLQRLVGDLMDLAKLDVRELPLYRQPTDLRALTAHAVHAHDGAAAQAGITLLPLPEGDPVWVDGDAHRLAQVLDNVLGNAISYAGAEATIEVTLAPAAPAAPVTLVIADTGRGIAPEHLPYIFDPFYRADAARTPGDNHSGLGLRIARGLIEAHGGTLRLESAPGEGTRVTITLPPAAPVV